MTAVQKKQFAVVDLGATNTRIAWSFHDAFKFEKIKIKTLQNYDSQVDKICQVLNSHKISQAILGIASPIDFITGQLVRPPNLRNYENHKPITDFAARDVRIKLFNDLELSALGEAMYGAGKNFTTVALVSIATGAGGALVKNREIIRGRFNFEPGHHIINLSGPRITAKVIGSFESYLSGSAIKYTGHHKPEELPEQYFASRINILCQVLANISLFWAPEIIILAGPVAKRYENFLPVIRQQVKKMIQVIPAPQLVMSALNDDAALIGGFSQKFF